MRVLISNQLQVPNGFVYHRRARYTRIKCRSHRRVKQSMSLPCCSNPLVTVSFGYLSKIYRWPDTFLWQGRFCIKQPQACDHFGYVFRKELYYNAIEMCCNTWKRSVNLGLSKLWCVADKLQMAFWLDPINKEMHIGDSVQDCSISIVIALKILLYFTKPSLWLGITFCFSEASRG